MNKILLVGGGGHCSAVIDVIEAEAKYEIFGIIDKADKVGKRLGKYEIVGTDEDLERMKRFCRYAHVSIGMSDFKLRRKLFDILSLIGYTLPTIISPNAYVSPTATIGRGNILMHHVLINRNVRIGENNAICSKVVLEHDVTVADNTYVAPGAILNGGVQVGCDCLVGAASVANQMLRIVDGVVIGSNSVVTKDIEYPGVYCGVPVRKIST